MLSLGRVCIIYSTQRFAAIVFRRIIDGVHQQIRQTRQQSA